METVRAFVAVLLDMATTRGVMEISRALRARLDKEGWKARWVPPPNLHVTLKFLGDIDAGLIDAVSDTLRRVATRHEPLRVRATGVRAFPDDGPPNVIYVGIEQGRDDLVSLARDVDASLAELGLPPDVRPYHPHVTIARVKAMPPHAPALARYVSDAADAGASMISEVSLYRSDLLRAGAEHSLLARHPLGKRPEAPGSAPTRV